jgi:hypothetical protein
MGFSLGGALKGAIGGAIGAGGAAMLGLPPSVGASLGSQILGGFASQDAADAQAAQYDQNIAMQKEFAQQGIRWKVEDAKAAGIHPLYALGANTVGFSPVATGDSYSPARGMAEMGQDVSRAIQATRTNSERTQVAADALRLQNMDLQNQLLQAQIAKLNQPGTPPARPDGTAPTGATKVEASKVETSLPGQPYRAAASNPSIEVIQTQNGPMVVPSRSASEMMESGGPLTVAEWHMRNKIVPLIDDILRSTRESGRSWQSRTEQMLNKR